MPHDDDHLISKHHQAPHRGTSPSRLWQAFRVTGMGQRIATLRRRKGLSQKTLAGLIGRSESWLSQVERGQREVGKLADIHHLAQALGVSADSIVGTPTPSSSGRAEDADTFTELANTLRRYLDLGPFLPVEPRPQPVTDLDAALDAANAAYQGADYRAAFAALPSLVATVDELGWDVPRAAHHTTHAWIITAKALHKVGENRLSSLAADRAANASRRGDIADQGFAARQVAENRMRAGDLDTAETLTVDMAHRIDAAAPAGSPPGSSPAIISAQGALWLLGAVIAARRTERFEALDRIDRAETLAERLGHDGNVGWSAFGPANVAIHAVSVAAELGDAGEALNVSRHVDPDQLPAGLISRRAQLHLDLAWALTQQRRDAEAIIHLLDAEDIAPNLIAVHPRIRAALSDLLGRTKPHIGGYRQLQGIATRAGLA